MEPTTALVAAAAAYFGRPLTASLARLALSACGQWGPRFLERLREARTQGALEAREISLIKAGAWDEALASERARRIENRQRIFTQAAHEASAGQEVPPTHGAQASPIDPDWWDAFWEGAEKVGNEDMQGVWARILAGECERPGSFSLRTLATVRLLSRHEAEVFSRWTGRCIRNWNGTAHLPIGKGLEMTGTTLDELTLLRSAGLLVAAEDMTILASGPRTALGPYGGSLGHVIVVSRVEAGQLPVYPQVPLTVVGCELYRIARPTPDLKYLETVVAAAQKAGWKTEVLPRTRVRLASDSG